MDTKRNVWCAVPECTKRFSLEDRYFFRFPKERERWLQWVRACGRLDLEPKGPEYAFNNCRLCHLHFEKKWYKINKIRTRLHPDAIPTIFFGPGCRKENVIHMEIEDRAETINENIDGEPENKTIQEKNSNMESTETLQKHVEKHMEIEAKAETNEYVTFKYFIFKNIDGEPADKAIQEKSSNIESAEALPIIVNNVDAEIVKPSTSKDRKQDMKSSEDSPRKKKLRLKIAKLKATNKTLRETIRRLRLKEKKTKSIQAKEEKSKQEEL